LIFIKMLAILFLAAGFAMVFTARSFVRKYKLDRNTRCEFENEMTEEEIEQYKFNKAVVNFKMLGLIVALPGLVLVLIAFR